VNSSSCSHTTTTTINNLIATRCIVGLCDALYSIQRSYWWCDAATGVVTSCWWLRTMIVVTERVNTLQGTIMLLFYCLL